jgi:hypothetical protein
LRRQEEENMHSASWNSRIRGGKRKSPWRKWMGTRATQSLSTRRANAHTYLQSRITLSPSTASPLQTRELEWEWNWSWVELTFGWPLMNQPLPLLLPRSRVEAGSRSSHAMPKVYNRAAIFST